MGNAITTGRYSFASLRMRVWNENDEAENGSWYFEFALISFVLIVFSH